MAWQVHDSDYEGLLAKFDAPVGFTAITAEQKADFKNIIELLDSKERVDAYLDELKTVVIAQQAIAANARRTAVPIVKMMGSDRIETRSLMQEMDDNELWGLALHLALREKEVAHEFDATKVYWLEGLLSAEDFLSLMTDKVAFMDPFVSDKHGSQTHRIQWWMIMSEIDKGRGTWNARKASDLYHAANSLKYKAGVEGTMWYLVFDAAQEKTARCPEFLKPYVTGKEGFDQIKVAEEQAMEWTTTPKGRPLNLGVAKRSDFGNKFQPKSFGNCEVKFRKKATS